MMKVDSSPFPVAAACTLVGLLAAAPARAADVTVDVQRDRRAIAPEIYGVIFGTAAQSRRMGITLRKQSGNHFSRYNYLASSSNEGGDGAFFKNLLFPTDGGFANSADDFVAEVKDAGLESAIELPMIGYVSKAGSPSAAPFDCGFSVAKYGAQLATDPLDANCGNGRILDGGWVPGTDPFDTSIAANVTFASAWVSHLIATHGSAGDGGVAFYNLGNQPALWWTTHRDVHPNPASYAELKTKLEQYGAAVKAADPQARTLGPAEWGWLAYFDSAASDRGTFGIDFVPYYLAQASNYELFNGIRILDYLDLHVYPQSNGVASGATDVATNALRLRSTRILWDPNYTVESWETCCYSGQQRIIPRMRDWVAQYYPGTKLAIGGYSWGALDHISGALAEIEVLGLFGREGVELATLETLPPDGAIGEDAFKLYRNYDGAGGQFGDTSIRAVSTNEPVVSAFAALRGETVTVVLVNKDPNVATSARVSFDGTSNVGPWRAFGLSGSSRLAALGSGVLDGGALTRVLAPFAAEVVEFTPTGGIPDAGIIDPDAGAPDGGSDGGAGGGSGGGGGGSAGGAGGGGGSAGGSGGGTAGGSGGGGAPPSGCTCGSTGTFSVALVAALAGLLTRRRRRSA